MVENVEMNICRYHRLSAAALAACIAIVVSTPLQAASIALVATEIGNPFRDTGVDIQSDNRREAGGDNHPFRLRARDFQQQAGRKINTKRYREDDAELAVRVA